ncbi:hypothetical protein P775_07150 [Puniceibacterium antarcticum]|uniref:Uncharacterized protein n=1 Tax=Puniceibacterium antarcticum TaxID=1206336 RepID=A0A2G8RH81_9RHOB|nr:hypothetical protein P775_07150 [Puniceibacterium antarcticum]
MHVRLSAGTEQIRRRTVQIARKGRLRHTRTTMTNRAVFQKQLAAFGDHLWRTKIIRYSVTTPTMDC